MAPTLGYWDVRGLAQPIRFLLAYTETRFQDQQYKLGPPPDYDKSAWYSDKSTLDLDFPNLPYYIDGDVKITQSLAIIRYLARKHKLDAETEEDKIKIDLIEQQITDFRMSLSRVRYSPDAEKLKDDYIKTLPSQLKLFSDFLGQRKWFAGHKITYVDFLIYEVLHQLRLFAPESLNNSQSLKEFLSRFENLPAIKKYMKSKDYIK